MRNALIILFFILILSVSVFLVKNTIISKIESTFIKNIEQAINKKIDIGGITYLPYKGIGFNNISIYEERSADKGINIKSVYAKIDIMKLLKDKQFIITVALEEINKNDISANGIFIIKSNPFESIFKPFKSFSINTVNIERFNISSPFLSLNRISGPLVFKENEIAASSISLNYKDKLLGLSFYAKNLKEEPFINIDVKGEDLRTRIQFRKIKDAVKIERSEIQFLDSYFEAEGEIRNFDNPLVSLDGSLNLETANLCQINPDLKKTCDRLKVSGKLDNKIRFEGYVNERESWKIELETRSPVLKVLEYRLYDLYFNLKAEDGIIATPLLVAHMYDGVLNSSFSIDYSKKSLPYSVSLKLKDLNVYELAQDSELRNKNIYGRLFAELYLKGNGSDTDALSGNGNISITDANLGPMPLLSPLLSQVYGVVRNMLPGLRSVEISGGSCDFTVENRKIITDNLALWGDILNINARGYIDFDKNLEFEVENEFKEVEEEAEDWHKTLVEIISGFGKFIGKAHLRGTLNKPKWEFEYFSNFEGKLGGKLTDIIRGIFE